MPEATPIASRADAEQADAVCPLAAIRHRFAMPHGVTYLDGNSLGALATHVPDRVDAAVRGEWGTDLITSWNDNGWWTLPRRVGDRIGALVGAAPGQVICGDSTSVQLFQALIAMARLRPDRRVLITDGNGFPTDQYIAESVARLLGLELLRVDPPDLGSVLSNRGAEVACVAYSAVDYRSGERWDADSITAEVHAAGALMMWDLCHAAGAMPFDLDGLSADAAVGCTYKYLNGGPGSPAWIYLPHRHQDAVDLPLIGWQGHAAPFDLDQTYSPAAGIDRGRIGTPPVLSMLALEAALDVFDDAPMPLIREKSLALTQLVIDYASTRLPQVTVATPADPARRGSQVALRMDSAYEVAQALIARRIIGDFRAPDVLRLGFAALYLSYTQVWDAMDALAQVLATEAWRDPAFARGDAAVT